jgi:hypothetical protein
LYRPGTSPPKDITPPQEVLLHQVLLHHRAGTGPCEQVGSEGFSSQYSPANSTKLSVWF